MLKRTAIALLAFAGAGLALPALAQMAKPRGFPERPLTIVVPYGPGGGSDQVSRAMAPAMEKYLGQPIQVINKPGAAGLAAVPDFMGAPADGYTIIQHIDDAITHFAAGKLKEDPTEDWSPLGISQITFSQLYIRTDDKRFGDWTSLLKHIQANPGKVSVANVSGAGTMERVQMSLVEQALGIKTNQISYDKPSERYASLIGGHVDVLFEQPGDIRQFLAAKQMKPVLTFLKERPAAFKDVPAIGEIAPNVPALLRFRGFFVKSGVPDDRLKYLEWAFTQGYRTPAYQKFNQDNYMDVIDSFRDRKGAIRLMKDTAAIYKKAYKELGITK